MTDLATLRALLERVEKASGLDRDLDLALTHKFTPGFVRLSRNSDDNGYVQCTYWEYTASINAAIALVERMLPGWRTTMSIGQDYSKCQFVKGWGARTEHMGVTERPDNELPLAILAALLSALIAIEEEKEKAK